MADEKDRKTNDPEALSGGAQGREPQSYGSESDWLTGKTGSTVQGTPQRTSRHDEEFYESRTDLDGETPAAQTPPAEGRGVKPVDTSDKPSTVTKAGGNLDERDSFFRERDYKDE